jgi:hypothetical protein
VEFRFISGGMGAQMGAIPTSSQGILSVRRRHGRLVRIIMMSAADRIPDEEKDLRSLIRQAAKETCKQADGLFGTTTSAASDWQRRFVKRAGCIVIDEAGAAVHSEIMIPWRNNKRLILAGDSRQLPPAVIKPAIPKKRIYNFGLKRANSTTLDKSEKPSTLEQRHQDLIAQTGSVPKGKATSISPQEHSCRTKQLIIQVQNRSSKAPMAPSQKTNAPSTKNWRL